MFFLYLALPPLFCGWRFRTWKRQKFDLEKEIWGFFSVGLFWAVGFVSLSPLVNTYHNLMLGGIVFAGGLLLTLWGFLKSDVQRIADKVQSAREHLTQESELLEQQRAIRSVLVRSLRYFEQCSGQEDQTRLVAKIEALAAVLRYAMSSPDTPVKVSVEIEHIQHLFDCLAYEKQLYIHPLTQHGRIRRGTIFFPLVQILPHLNQAITTLSIGVGPKFFFDFANLTPNEWAGLRRAFDQTPVLAKALQWSSQGQVYSLQIEPEVFSHEISPGRR